MTTAFAMMLATLAAPCGPRHAPAAGPPADLPGVAQAVLPCLVTLASRQDRPLVLILAGQSNMEGQGRTADLTADQLRLPATVRLFDRSGEVDPASRPRFGPEIGLARALVAAMPGREIILVKHAVGGTSLLNWAPEWDSARAAITPHATAGRMYADLIGVIRGLGVLETGELGAVFWMQGERDARVPEAGADYFENLAGLVAAFRRDLRSPQLPFILGIVNPPPASYPMREGVREAQRRAAREVPGVVLVETDDLSKWDDNLHYDTAGILELGRRFAAALMGPP